MPFSLLFDPAGVAGWTINEAFAMATEPVNPAEPPTIEFDLPCLKCNYNLRGLSGDPLRCPECGHVNLLRGMSIPEDMLAARLRRMEGSLLACVGGLHFAAPFQFIFWVIVVVEAISGSPPVDLAQVLVCVGIPAFVPLLMWIGSVLMFRASCQAKPGWVRLLARYHLYGLGMGGAMAVGVAVSVYVAALTDLGIHVSDFLVPVVYFGGMIVFVKVWLRRRYRRLMADVHEMQREKAIADLRAEARQRVASIQHLNGS